ncbi:hypothetical protein [Chlamydia felis Fe/C-56]|uniref:Uncharacterized protein n=1 Tax=Chlamydia felis (strain Fe/C-56) TaxID=264202 RepID=Q254A7_CHLFF|nr:hypothetical protein [Chlamydia felis]BAE81381.1 hypothetical protein [Chlamydia felis Fe/C-56]
MSAIQISLPNSEVSTPPVDSSKNCAKLLSKHEKIFVACILGLAGILTLSGITLAIIYPSATLIIVLSLLFCLTVLSCLLDCINTQSASPAPALLQQQTPFIHPKLYLRENSPITDSSRIPSTMPQYPNLLSTLWTESRWSNLPHQIRPQPSSIQQTVWRLNSNPGIILISTVGDITKPRTISECTLIMVNPADETLTGDDPFEELYPFYGTVSTRCWEEAKQTRNGKPSLTPGSCSIKFRWESVEGDSYYPNSGLPFWFSHVYNPPLLDQYDPVAAFLLCKETYTNCFEEAISGNIPATMVQIPLLFSETMQEDCLDDENLQARLYLKHSPKTALVVALQEFSERHPHISLTVVVVKDREMPIEYSYSFPKQLKYFK